MPFDENLIHKLRPDLSGPIGFLNLRKELAFEKKALGLVRISLMTFDSLFAPVIVVCEEILASMS